MNNDLNNLNNNITPQPMPNTDSLTPQPIPNPNPQQANPQPMSNTDLLTPQPIPGENQNLDTNQNTRSDQIISINSNNIIPDTNIKDSSIESKDNSLEKQTIEEPNPNNIIKESSINENTQTINKENNIINDEELLKAFIGNNYDKITTNKFNIAGFFLSTLYLFYRKMFGYGLLVFIINIILVSITNKTELTIILNIAVGLLVNRLYISFANSKIAIIKQNNLEKSNEELKNICTNKGGTSIFLPFLGIIVEIIISIIIFMILGLIGITTMFGSLLNSATSAKNGTFNGIFEYESGIKIEDEFTVTVPNRFENDSEDYIFISH